MKKYFILYHHNLLFFKPNRRDKETIKTVSENWAKYVYPDFTEINGTIKPSYTDRMVFSNLNDVDKLSKEYQNKKNYYQQQILVFHSLSDINPNVNKALRYTNKLIKTGYTVFLLSINPFSDLSQYLERFWSYYGYLSEQTLYQIRDKKEKYNPELLRFASNLRLGNPVKYNIIKQHTGIPKSTIISYLERNHLKPTLYKTGRNSLTKEEIDELNRIIDQGGYFRNY